MPVGLDIAIGVVLLLLFGWAACAWLMQTLARVMVGVHLRIGEAVELSFGAMVLWGIVLAITSGVLAVVFQSTTSPWLISMGMSFLHATTFRPSLWGLTAVANVPLLAALVGPSLRRVQADGMAEEIGWGAGLGISTVMTAALLALGALLAFAVVAMEHMHG